MEGANFLNDEVMENFKKALDNPVELQVFKTLIYKNRIEGAIKEHAEAIIKHIGMVSRQ